MYFISSICNNYYRIPSFFSKIERTLHFFKANIKKYYSNSEIFNVFKDNKRIILFLIKEKIMIVDKFFIQKITTNEFEQKYYPEYFAPEIKPFMNEEWFTENRLFEYLKKEQPSDFNELRDKGENNSFICKLIREDLIQDFVIHFNKNCISSNATINPSIYETNSFLLEKQNQLNKCLNLIEYAAFFGSIQIFTFLKNENADLTSSLWLYAIHGKNADLIHLLEELHVEPTNESDEELYEKCFQESIKCHHNDIANYFLNNYLHYEDKISYDTFIQCLKYHNFAFLQNECMNELSFCHFCYFDYYSIVKALLAGGEIDINSKIIQNYFFQ